MTNTNLKDKSIIKTEEMVLNMGPQHPSTHGVLRLKIHTDGEIVFNLLFEPKTTLHTGDIETEMTVKELDWI
mgnify:CR=1 FL=1